jgi:hypothetical protein
VSRNACAVLAITFLFWTSQGAKGHSRYFWHAVADQSVGSNLTEAVVPAVTREDRRYYTHGQ